MASLSFSSSEGDAAAAEQRLREAEERLREAIEELNRRRQRRRQSGGDECDAPACDHAGESCAAHALGNLCQTFLLSYGVRVGIGILLRAFKLARRQSYSSLIDLKCAYNSAKSKNRFHLWGSHWSHGDSLLFALSCAQVSPSWSEVMYAFVMRPESLPRSYQDFILKTGPVAEVVYRAVRNGCRGCPVDVDSLAAYLSDKKESKFVDLVEHPPIIPCSIIHPDTRSCLAHNAVATSTTFRKTFPLYFSLTLVPFVVLHLSKVLLELCLSFVVIQFMENPPRTLWNAIKGSVRSTAFLSVFVGAFQAVICIHRKLATKDHKLVYWLAGGIAGLSVLLEKKPRRGELALYVLPRAGDSLWYILVNRHLLPDIKNAEVPLFCLCMGGIMYYLEQEPDTMAPFLRGLIRRFLASRISNPNPSFNSNSSHSYLQSLDTIDKPKLQAAQEKTPASPEKYNLESFSGL
ncbi:hypothetical protein Taro_000815 [Colocasia esculenta]|uniref:Transmembrane protein 135 N-terminal domain-containing protein n=1 Tax=Colocasia esculenta TaxID=4460 RepID=A0A843T8F1_COLES|nr:hypothetical protein [Colocasia esculenta]